MEQDRYDSSLPEELATQRQKAMDVATAAQEVYELNTWKSERRQRIQFSFLLLGFFLALFVLRVELSEFSEWTKYRLVGTSSVEILLGLLLLVSSWKVRNS